MISFWSFKGIHVNFIFTVVLQAANCDNRSDSYNYSSRDNFYESGPYYQGDIMLSSERSAVGSLRTWKNGVIPYIFEDGYLKVKIPLVNKGMAIYFNLTNGCIRFVKRTNEKDYLVISSKHNQCTSYVGRNGGPQLLKLGLWCTIRGIIHELHHAIGFLHEQNRPDRDEYLEIKWKNMNKKSESYMRKAQYPYNYTYGVPYDYLSISHYTPFAYSRNGNPVIITKDPKYQNIIGKLPSLSENDILEIKRMYKCK
ncbi:UNVERIFIED_CONTAM: hypothetical protein RMT77_002798 [Armadillidium vulgare]